jgi:hypothetical protein
MYFEQPSDFYHKMRDLSNITYNNKCNDEH